VFDTIPPGLGPFTTGDDETSSALDAEMAHPLPGAVLLTVDGEIDTMTAPRFEAALDRLLAEPDDVLVVDLTGTTFLASCGLAVLIRAAHGAEASRRRIRLVTDGRPVRRPLEITGADQLFDLHDDRGSAGIPGHDQPRHD